MTLPPEMTTIETSKGIWLVDAVRTDRVVSGPFLGEVEAGAWVDALGALAVEVQSLLREDGEAPLNISTDPTQAAIDIAILRQRP